MSTDHSNLQIEVEEQEAWRRRLTVTVPAGSVQTERTKIIQKLGGKLKLPGFRKGKIPSNVVEQRFGQALDQELMDKVIGDAYRQALQAHSLEPISEGKVEDVEYKPREDLTFSISFDIQPEIELERLGGFSVERKTIQVAQEDIDRVLGRLQDQAAVWKPVEEGARCMGTNANALYKLLHDARRRLQTRFPTIPMPKGWRESGQISENSVAAHINLKNENTRKKPAIK